MTDFALRARAVPAPPAQKSKSFCAAFFKKRLLLVLAGALAGAPLAHAGAPVQDCGTIVLPTGVGVGNGADITSMNPLLVTSLYNQQAASLLYQGLIWLNASTGKIDWSRSIASSVTTPDDDATYDVSLRPWHWSDGVPVTTADVAYTFKLIKELGTTYAAYGAGGMPGIVKALDIISPTQFRVVLTHRVNPTWFIYNGLSQLLPLPAHSWGKDTVDEIFQGQSSPAFFSVVDGPLRAQRLDIGLDLVLVPNPAYDGPKLHFQRLIFKFVEGDGAALQGVESGDLDMANAPLPLWRAVQHLPGLKLTTLPPVLAYDEIALNFRNPAVPFFRDVRVRQAMADAIDQATIIKLVDHGQGVEIHAPVVPEPPTFLSPEMKAGHYPVGYDPAKARALLQAAGYSPGPDGIMQKDGKKLSFVYLMLSGNGANQQIAELTQAYLLKIGMQMKVREIEFNQLVALLVNPKADWQAAGLGETTGVYPSGEEVFGTGASQNAGGYSNAQMDRLITASTVEPGLSGLYAYQNYASAQQPVIFQAAARPTVLSRARIQGVRTFVDPSGGYYPDQLTCSAGGATS
ncbi:MAG TPA: peptide ABC transporter substrate-binding protein [Acidocella sp.]|jgi:peptide/nickel transport system substrate-binding protein|nr:peptide ABC transporter substrate-binding protein [Acidocella sp.]